jgi:hypothetical protein
MKKNLPLKAFDTAMLDGKLHVATDNGVYIAGDDGPPKLEGRLVRAFRSLSSGVYAVTGGGLFRRSGADWWGVHLDAGSALDVAETAHLLYVASIDDLRVYANLPAGWEEAALRSAMSFDEASAPPGGGEARELRRDEASIVGRGGRSLFSGGR